MRARVRAGSWTGPTAGRYLGFAQANVVIVPALHAAAFAHYCQINPMSCPVLEVLEAGVFEPRKTAPGADIRTDCPRCRVFRRGEMVGEQEEIAGLWRNDLLTFLLGCSFTFEGALLQAGVPLRHMEEGVNVPMYVTNVPCAPAPPFAGNMVVSMRPVELAITHTPGHMFVTDVRDEELTVG